ncbi:MAG: type II toxin-antitoxin system RelE/ParE family toxin [Steroidobacteraceae bacterium]
MKAKSVVPRERAVRDGGEANDQYLSDNAPGAALGFIAALEDGYRHIGRYPGTGSSRFAGELSLPDLRFRRLENYPHLIFYCERSDYIDVWRVLHGMRDIPSWMHDPDLIAHVS